MRRIGEGGPLVKRDPGSLIPSRNEIIKDLIKFFFTEYGLELAEKLWEPIPLDKLVELAKKHKRPWTLPAPSGGGGGGGMIALALVALATQKKKRRK